MKRVFICAPLGGNREDQLKQAMKYTEYALKSGAAPVVPLFFEISLHGSTRNAGKIISSAGISLLWLCDELWVFGNRITKEMQQAIDFCKNLNTIIRTVSDSDINKVIGGNCT